MKLQEILKEQNLNEEQINTILAAMKNNNIFTANEENLDIRYGKLKTDFDGLTAQHNEATKLIEEMKKANKGNEDLQNKIVNYEQEVKNLQEELKQTKVEAAVKVALLEAKVTDIDYMTFKLKEKGEIELDENEKIKNWDDKIAGLKTQFPNHFENAGQKKIDENKLKEGDDNRGFSKNEILKKSYNERAKLYLENPEAFKETMQNN